MIKIAFLSNFLNHHQKPLLDELYCLTDGNVRFIATDKIDEERLKLGYQPIVTPYLWECSDSGYTKVLRYINDADAVIIGSAPYEFVKQRIRNGKLTFLYTERLYKNPPGFLRFCWHFLRFQKQFNIHRSTRLLCASAFAYSDFRRLGCFKNRAYKWGYFPTVSPAIHTYINKCVDQPLKIMWAARFIDWKHPEMVVKLGEYLKQNNINFTIDFFGCGKIESDIRNMVSELSLNSQINFHGSKENSEILREMARHDIFLQTSDCREGWGATLNEAMSSGCAVIASDAIGSAPYLIENGVNGILFHSCEQDSLNKMVIHLAQNTEMIEQIGRNAAQTMENCWSPKVAATNFIELAKAILSGADTPCAEGPCSKA